MSHENVRITRKLNPAYILSAVCMIFGLFALNGSLDFSPLPARNLLLLMGVLNAYEALLLLIAWLLHRRRIDIDARTLIVIEALFLFDGAFLTSELISVMPSVGVPMAIVLSLAAILKTWVILAIAGKPIVGRLGAMAMLMLSVLVALPWSLQSMIDRHGELPEMGYYLGWWMVAIVPALGTMLWRSTDGPLMHTIIGIGAVSILAHICTAAWVNKVLFSLTDCAPAMLGISLLVGHGRLIRLSRGECVRFELLVPLLAVLLSARPNAELSFEWIGLHITPLRLALVGTAMVYLHGLLRHRDWTFGAALFVGGTVPIVSANAHAIGTSISSSVRGVFWLIDRMIPRTLVHWGWLSIASSFALMLGGAWLSTRRKPVEMEQVTP